jgi:hypothetical protein
MIQDLTDQDFDEILEARKKRKKKIKKKFLYLFPPFYGKGYRVSTVPPSAPSGDVSSPAYPGVGGINAPSVPAGPNTGMGPT